MTAPIQTVKIKSKMFTNNSIPQPLFMATATGGNMKARRINKRFMVEILINTIQLNDHSFLFSLDTS